MSNINQTISIIIPNYNGISLLRKNLPKLCEIISKYKKGFVEIIIVDDFSIDESVKFLNEFVKNGDHKKIPITILVNEKNKGFSSTVNKGVEISKGDVLILLNTDVIVTEGFLEPLVAHFTEDDVFAVGCNEVSISESQKKHYGRGTGSWQRGFLLHHAAGISGSTTLWVSCGSGAFSKKIWDKLGGLDTLYNPFYWEDIDLSYRAAKCGYKVLFEKKSLVTHEHDKGSIKSNYSTFEINSIAYRNQFTFVWKNATDFNLQILHILWLPYHFIKAISNFDMAFFYGFFAALKRLPVVMRSSFRVQKLFVKSDKQVIETLD